MKKNYTLFLIFCMFLFDCSSAYSITTGDYREVIKTTKKICKLSKQNKFDELDKYISDDYKSFDGFNKEEMLKILELSSKIYPDAKSKENIFKVLEDNDLIKVYINETSSANMDVEGENALYAITDKVKGVMNSKSTYAVLFKKEDNKYKIVGDEIFEEETEIRYGEAIGTDFKMETPDILTPDTEFSVKIKLQIPNHRFVVGSIGHDKIVYPPKKYFDPYRSPDRLGIIERVMKTNNEGKNEYINSTFAYIAPVIELKKIRTEEELKKAAISGMGITVKRVNLEQNKIAESENVLLNMKDKE